MKPRPKPQDSGTQELFRAKLRNIINLQHELVRLGQLIDWQRLEMQFAPYYREAGRPGLPIRLVVVLHLLKHIEGLSDEAVCERWERDPYMQYFCGEEYFQHAFPLERSGMTHFRKRVGEEALETLLQETLAAAYRGGALSVQATEAVAVDTTVQVRAWKSVVIAHPTEHGLLRTAIEQLGRHAKKTGLHLRQSYVRVARRAAMKAGRYLHAQQKRRAKRQGEISAGALAAADPRRASQNGGAARAGGIVRGAAGVHAGTRLAHRAPTARRSRLCLFLARSGDRMHQQGQSARPVRIRLQSFHRHESASGQGRPLHLAGARVARQSVRWSHAETGAGRCAGNRGPQPAARRGRPGIQRTPAHGSSPHGGLHHRAETRRHG